MSIANPVRPVLSYCARYSALVTKACLWAVSIIFATLGIAVVAICIWNSEVPTRTSVRTPYCFGLAAGLVLMRLLSVSSRSDWWYDVLQLAEGIATPLAATGLLAVVTMAGEADHRLALSLSFLVASVFLGVLMGARCDGGSYKIGATAGCLVSLLFLCDQLADPRYERLTVMAAMVPVFVWQWSVLIPWPKKK